MDQQLDPSVAVINVEDHPHIDWKTDDGKDELGAVAADWHWHDKSKWHFLFQWQGVTIGEMVITPAGYMQ